MNITNTKEQGKHTPGEWYTKENGFMVYGGAGKVICTCHALSGQIDNDQRTANAALIASAPELLKENEQLKEQVRLLREALEESNKVSKMYISNTETHPDFKMGKDSTITHYFEVAIIKAESALNQTKN